MRTTHFCGFGGGGVGCIYPHLDTLPPKYPTPQKEHGTKDTQPPGQDMGHGPYPTPCGQNDTDLWKHYLPATSLAGGNKP